MTEYEQKINAPVFACEPEWSSVTEYSLKHHLWSKDYPAFWHTGVKLCAVKGKGIYARLRSDEEPIKAVFGNIDDPVYSDSCMELFLQPFSDDLRYINIEINPNCAYLAAVGAGRNDRISVSSLSDERCSVSRLNLESGWGIELFIPESFISSAFSRRFSVGNNELKGNVYKCGDETAFVHYSSLFFVGTPTPDYHRSEYFGVFNFFEEKE